MKAIAVVYLLLLSGCLNAPFGALHLFNMGTALVDVVSDETTEWSR